MSKKSRKTVARVAAAAGMALAAGAANANSVCDPAIDGCEGIGDLVWNDLNRDGIQDAGEPGLSGVDVNLLNGNDNSLLYNTQTDATGNYMFYFDIYDENVFDFKIEFILEAGYAFSPLGGAGVPTANNNDSDAAVPISGITGSITGDGTSSFISGPGIVTYDVDAGMYEVPVPAAVWLFGSGLLGLIGIARRKKAA